VMPTLSAEGLLLTQTIRYLDSKDLQHQLHILNIHAHADQELERAAEIKDGKVSTKHSEEEDSDDEGEEPHSEFDHDASLPERSGKGQTSRHIPIFMFSLNGDTPVFIDKYYQAKALGNVILAVQSRHHNYTSKLACNGKAISWDLRNPLKPLLASTALHYGGLVPMHVTYDESNQCAAQDWLWSVGDNPLSHTSRYHRFSQLQTDITYRNFIVQSVEDSVSVINQGIKSLARLHTTKANFQAIDALPLYELAFTHQTVQRMWDSYARASATLNFEIGVSSLGRLADQTDMFRRLVLQTEDHLDQLRCQVDTSGETSMFGVQDSSSWWMLPALLVFNVILALLWILLRKTSLKVKTN